MEIVVALWQTQMMKIKVCIYVVVELENCNIMINLHVWFREMDQKR